MAKAIGPWRRWWRLPGAEKRIAVALAWRLPLVDLSLRLTGVKRTRRRMLRGIAAPSPGPCNADVLARATRLAALAASVGGRGGKYTNCLRQALLVEQRLRRQGLPAELKIGVRKGEAGRLDAHAWVELDGVALAQGTLRHASITGASEHL